jgi:hypothetical protein
MADTKLDLTGAAVAERVEAEIRDLVRTKNVQDRLPDLGSDILKAGEGSIAEIDKLMVELQAARDYLRAEGDRVRRMADRYGHLTRTASESVRVISESMGKWRNPELAVVVPSDAEPAKEAQTSI